jgi:hypothetical protein
MLADIDELKQKMEQSPQQAQLADERKQLDQTRSEAQKAAEAMKKNEPSQALASGTRAARELQQMREDFRKKTSNQFRDEMRDMRADARQLADRQQEIGEKLKEAPARADRPTLDGSSDQEKLGQQFEKQKQQLTKLTDDMKRVSEQAEAAEPLLAKELYEAVRKTTQTGTSDTLEKTQQLAQRGFKPQAQQFEEKARQEIDELKKGVERAAESVLGDEAEALRQARAELDTLTKQLEREVAQARPDLAARAEKEGGQPKPGEGKKPGAEGEKTADGGKAGDDSKADAKTTADAAGTKPGTQPMPGNGQQGDQGKTASADGKGEKPGVEGKGDKPGAEGKGEQPGKDGEGKTAGQTAQQNGQPSQQPGQGQQPGQNPQPGKGEQAGKDGQSGKGQTAQTNSPKPNSEREGKEGRGGLWGGATDGQEGPMTGSRFVEWQDRLRNVEEMLDAPELRNEAARVREIARGVRAEFKRHAGVPNWEMVDSKIAAPLAELRNRVTEELARRESKENLVPIDRDPVPTKYAERVRRYYEDLGRSER